MTECEELVQSIPYKQDYSDYVKSVRRQRILRQDVVGIFFTDGRMVIKLDGVWREGTYQNGKPSFRYCSSPESRLYDRIVEDYEV